MDSNSADRVTSNKLFTRIPILIRISSLTPEALAYKRNLLKNLDSPIWANRYPRHSQLADSLSSLCMKAAPGSEQVSSSPRGCAIIVLAPETLLLL